MTYDKIVHYLGSELVDELADLPITELEFKRDELSKELENEPNGTTHAFFLNVQLKFINHLLK